MVTSLRLPPGERMKPEAQFLPTRSAVVFAHTRRLLDSTQLNLRKFAALVAERYVELVDPEARTVPFRAGVTVDDIFKAEKANAQTLARYMDGTVKVLPADLEDAWVSALADPFRQDCERELARRRNLLAVPVVDCTEAGDVHCMARLAVEFGQLLEALGPALADGKLSEADLPYAARILNETEDLLAALMAIRTRVAGLVPKRTA